MVSDRTNRYNSFQQLRELQRGFAGRESRLQDLGTETHKAVVLYADPKTVPLSVPLTTPTTPTLADPVDATVFNSVFGLSGPPKYKIHFRVPIIHEFLPLPPSFRNIAPLGDISLKGHTDGEGVISKTYKGDSCLKPEAEEELLISVHPSLYVPTTVDGVTQARLNPGDVIEVRFPGGRLENAEFVKTIQKGLNLIDHSSLINIKDAASLFDGETEDMVNFLQSDGPIPAFAEDPSIKATTKELLDAILYKSGVIDQLDIAKEQRKNADRITSLFSEARLGANIAMAAVVNAYAESQLDNQVCFGRTPWGSDRYLGPKQGEENSCGLFQLNAAKGAAGEGMTVEERKNAITNTQKIIEVVKSSGGKTLRDAAADGAPLSELIYLFTRDIERPANREKKGIERSTMAQSWWGEKVKIEGKNLTYSS